MNTTQTFNAANDYLRGRVNVLNNMSSRELSAQLLPEIRAQSFFSARVAEARVLEKLRDVSDRYSAGQMDAATARLEIKNWLKVGDNVKDENIREALMSTARLDLILNQNQMMAAAVGARELALDPEIYEALPYYRYVPSTAANPRDAHRQFYGIVLDKKDPFWQTHTPPLDFGCKCSLDELTANEAGDKVGKAEQSSVASRQSSEGSRPALAESGSWSVSTPDGAVIIDTPESGYVFDVNSALSTCDMSRIDDITIRKAVLSQMRDFSRENPDTVFRCIPGTALTDKAVADFNPKEFSQFMESQKTYYAENNKKFDSTARLKIGNLSTNLTDAIGISPANVWLSGGTGSIGLNHAAENHAAQILDGTFENNLRNILGLSGGKLRISMHFTGKKVYLNIFNPVTGDLVTLARRGEDWNNWELVSSFVDTGFIDGKKTVIKAKKKPQQSEVAPAFPG